MDVVDTYLGLGVVLLQFGGGAGCVLRLTPDGADTDMLATVSSDCDCLVADEAVQRAGCAHLLPPRTYIHYNRFVDQRSWGFRQNMLTRVQTALQVPRWGRRRPWLALVAHN